MGTTPDFNVVFKQILLRNGISIDTKRSNSCEGSKRRESVCPEHPSDAVPSLTLPNHGHKSCAELNRPLLEQSLDNRLGLKQLAHDRPHLEQTVCDKPLLEETLCDKPLLGETLCDKPLSKQTSSDKPLSKQTSSDKPLSKQTSSDKPLSKQTSSDKPLSKQTSSDKPCLEQTANINKPILELLKHSSGRAPVGNKRGFNHSQDKVPRGKPNVESQQPSKFQGKVCPEHACYALPSLTLKNHGCRSCARMNSAEHGSTGNYYGKPQFEQMKQFSRPFRERTHDPWSAAEHNQRGFNHSQSRMPRGKHYSQGQRSKNVEDETKQVLEILDLSRNFYKRTDLESDIKDFDGARVGPYLENSPVFEKYVDDVVDSRSSSRLQCGVKKSSNYPRGSNWRPHSAKHNVRELFTNL